MINTTPISSPLPPPFQSKTSHIQRDSRLTAFCHLLAEYYTHIPPCLTTTCDTISLTPSKIFWDPYILSLYYQEYTSFQNIHDPNAFTLYFKYDKTATFTFHPEFLHQDITTVYNQFLNNFLDQSPLNEQDDPAFPYQRSSFGNLIDILSNQTDQIDEIRHRYPQNDPMSHLQKDLDLLIIIFLTIFDQFHQTEDPDTSLILILSHFLQYYFKIYFLFQTLTSIQKYKPIISQYLPEVLPVLQQPLNFSKTK